MPKPEESHGSAQARKQTPDTATAELAAGPDNVLFDVWLVSRAATALIDDAVRTSGLDADEFAIYSVLASTQGMTPSELARWMSAPATTVSSYIKRFERRGHVLKVPNREDGRSYRVQLTAGGRKVHRAAGDLFQPTLLEVTGRLGTESSDAHRRLWALHRVLDTLMHDQPPDQ